MKLPVTTVNALQSYINGVMKRAAHHAGSVQAVSLALAGAIVWKKKTSVDVYVLSKSGDVKNALWVEIGKKQYAFSYDHAGSIDMREGNLQGPIMHKFTDTMTLAQVHSIFAAL